MLPLKVDKSGWTNKWIVSRWKYMLRSMLQGSILDPVIDIFINYLNAESEPFGGFGF